MLKQGCSSTVVLTWLKFLESKGHKVHKTSAKLQDGFVFYVSCVDHNENKTGKYWIDLRF